MRLCLPVLLLLGIAAVADEPKPGAKEKEFSAEAKKELKKLEGKWRLVKIAATDGEVEMKDKELYYVFKGTEVTQTFGDKMATSRVDALDAATDPKCIDLTVTREGAPDRTLEAVYRIDGDTLQIAFSLAKEGKNRPTSVEKPSDLSFIWTFKRVKE
jgi:uncharacterized protein (TIGR03067 family)